METAIAFRIFHCDPEKVDENENDIEMVNQKFVVAEEVHRVSL